MGSKKFRNYAEHGKWDFRGFNTKEYTHCFHIYPAMMIPQIARELINRYGVDGGLLFDPYCGTGTSLVEARLANMNSIGTDLNPTARMISRTKNQDYDLEILDQSISILMEEIGRYNTNQGPLYGSEFETYGPEPEFITWEKLQDWFPKQSISEISFALGKIRTIEDTAARWFLKVALSECLRLVSFQRNREFKLYRIPENKRSQFYIPLFPLLKKRIERNRLGLQAYMDDVDCQITVNVHPFNTVWDDGYHIFSSPDEMGGIDLVVTSPPYGDSGTTVAYAQFSWLTNVWLGLDDKAPGALDRELMGGRRSDIEKFDFKPIDGALEAIRVLDKKRATEVMNFYVEYRESIRNVAGQIKPGGHACYVVGNRTVKGQRLPTDQFTAWAFEQEGFEYITTYVREIPNKRMPSKNSPSNIEGQTASTMESEYIVVCQKNEIASIQAGICMSDNIDLDSNDSLLEFSKRFSSVLDMGWVPSHRSNNTGIGKTLEDLMDISENNLDEADIGDVEIKSQRALTSSKITLFTKKPTYPDDANKILRDRYGVQNPKHPDLNQMHASMFNHWNQTYEKWGMRLRPDNEKDRMYLEIKDLETGDLEDFECWYSYDVIREIIAKKMNILAYVSADSRTDDNGGEEFLYTKCEIYHGGTFERFLHLMNEGKIQYDIRIGSYKTPGKSYGRVHDHGSGFRISRAHLAELFEGQITL
tara:strand:- start:1252 stop:3360 length:2109 start_codon:yes stop_codon:yes gene_type:complete